MRDSQSSVVNPLRPLNRRITLFLLLVAILMTSLVAYFTPTFDIETYACDHLFYRSMAFNLFEVTRPELNKVPPGNFLWTFYSDPYFSKFYHSSNRLNRQPSYIFRIITPLFARAIGWLFFRDNVNYGFYTVTFLSLVFTCFFISLTLYLFTNDVIMAILGSYVFSFFEFTSPFHLYDYMLTDPLAFLFISIAIFLMLRQRRIAFFLVCLVGLFNKETVGFLIPCYLLWELLGRRLRLSSVIAAVTISIAYVAFRNLWPVLLSVPVNNYSLRTIFMGIPNWLNAFLLYLYVFGILFYFTISRMWLSKFTLSLAPLAILSFTCIFFAGDKERMIIYAFPLVLLSVLGIRAKTIKAKALTIAPIFAYFLFKFIETWSPLRMRFFLPIQFSTFVVLETAFFHEYFKSNSRYRIIIAKLKNYLLGG